jgi:hypothetical protein
MGPAPVDRADAEMLRQVQIAVLADGADGPATAPEEIPIGRRPDRVMTRPRVYVETSVISYLTARPSREPLIAAHQAVTRAWWARRDRFDLVISKAVLDEITRGDAAAAARRVAAIEGVPVLAVTDAAQALARGLINGAAIPSTAAIDAAHVALAATHGADLLVTWNCTHIANAAIRVTIEAVCHAAGYRAPTICTPLELQTEETEP